MAVVLVLGAGMNGLSTGMLLARDGHEVTVLDRDPGPPPDDVWRGWQRPGVAQFRMLHFALPRWRREMEQCLPEVLGELEGAGGLRMNWMAMLPAALRGPLRADDAAFETVTARRPVLEAALAAVASHTPGLTVRRGVVVDGLTATRDPALGVPRVTGVALRGGATLSADLVVECGGRRSDLDGRLAALGARAPREEVEEQAYVYYCRHYRSRSGELPELRAPVLAHHDSVSLVTLPCDNRTWAVGFVGWSGDRVLRALRDPARWEAALGRYPLQECWGTVSGEPITGVEVMGGLRERSRELVIDGDPVATGVVAVGDAWAFVNPATGRGMSIGLVHARALQQVLREVDPNGDAGGDTAAEKVCRRFAEVTATTAEPLYRATLAFNRHRLAEMIGDATGRPYETDDPAWTLAKALAAASGVDPDALRVQSTLGALHATPAEVFAAPGLAARVLALGGGAPRHPLPGPDRRELVATLAA